MDLNENTIEFFRTDINHFTQLEKDIKDLKNKIKPLKDALKRMMEDKKELEKLLYNTMKKNDLCELELPNNKGFIEYKVTNALVPIKRDDIKIKLIEFFEEGPGSKLSFNSLKQDKKGLEVYDYIYSLENREKVRKESLKSINLL